MLAGLSLIQWRRGTWTPPALSSGVVRLLLVVLALDAAVRAADYSIGRDGPAPRLAPLQVTVVGRQPPGLNVIEQAAPLWMWAVGLGVGVAALLCGMVGRWSDAVWAGHSVLGTLYAALAVGYAIDAFGAPWLDGIRGTPTLAVIALLHTILGWEDAPMRVRPAGRAVEPAAPHEG